MAGLREELGGGVSAREFFTPMAFEVLWETMQLGDVPYPLALDSHGPTENERVRLRNQVITELAGRGVCDAYGRAEPRVEKWLGLLSMPVLSVDALHIPAYEAEPIAMLAAADEHSGVLAIQDAQGVWLSTTFPDGLASAVVEQLPHAQRGTETSISLPLDEAMHVQPDGMTAGGRSPNQGTDEESGSGRRGQRKQQRSLADRPSDPRQAYARLAGQPRLCGGQLAANSRDVVGAKQRSPVLAWFDTATGRYLSVSRSGADGRDWVTVSPADVKTLRGRLTEMIEEITPRR